MTDQRKKEKLEHRNILIEKERRQLKCTEKSIVMPWNNNKKDNSITDIVGDVDLNMIRDLSLRSRNFNYLPEGLCCRLKNLMYLDLSDNNFSSLPFSLHSLVHLRSLILNQNNLQTLPLTITKMTNLRVLQLSKNNIGTLPSDLGYLMSLESLNLSSNSLEELPDSWVDMNRLKYLNISKNFVRKLPNCIGRGMRALETLDVSKNLHINIAMSPASKKLKNLYVRKCGLIGKFPTWLLIGRAPLLQVFECDGTKFKNFFFPNNCQSLKLQILSMEACLIFEEFVQDITSLTDELKILRIGNNDSMKNHNIFWKMPISSLKRPRLMTEIGVRGTGLPNLCHEINKFVYLVKLDLGENRINWLPDEICQLENLEVLMVDKNELSSLPENIGRMKSLKDLKVAKNHLASLPKSIKELKELSYLDLYDNDFQEIPEDLKHVESLCGVDIDLNNITIDDLCIRNLQYMTLRSNLREHYPKDGSHRSTGPRYESENEGELYDSRSNTSSESDESETTVTDDENGAKIEENWDESDESADEMEFDCEKTVSPKPKTVSFVSKLSERFVFCPADLHHIPVREQVALKRQRGEIKDDFEVVEGQFDDF